MTIRLRTAFILVVIGISIWFLYIERAILTPFILAAIFAYVFNPVVNFLTQKLRVPRGISIVVIFLIIIFITVYSSLTLTKRIFVESSELKHFIDHLPSLMKTEVSTLPQWLAPTVNDVFLSLESSRLLAPVSLVSFFPQAISRLVSFFIFLFSSFYFLKEGRNIFDKLILFAPKDYRFDLEVLLKKINASLGGYLRGQVFLIVLVSFILFVVLSILGVRFALLLAIFSGIAEIVPIIGPILATSVAAVVVLIGGVSNFPLPNTQAAIVVIIIYFVVRQIQDYFITPHVLGKVTNLHPLIIFFAVLAGGHIAGGLGLVLGVPIAATIRILGEYTIDKINEKSLLKPQKNPRK